MMPQMTLTGAVLRENVGFTIIFLDAGGCASCGDTLEEVLAMGKEAVEGYLAVAIDSGDPLPQPTEHSIADVDAWLYDGEEGHDDRGTWVGLFPVEVEIPPRVATIPVHVKADLVQRIAELSQGTARQIDSGRFIEEAVEHEIERYRKSA